MKARETGFPPGLAGGLGAALWRLQGWWEDQPRAARSSIWAGLAATLAIVVLVFTFHHAVRAAVQQGELRRAATSLQGDAARRCNTLRGQRLRDACLQQLYAEPPDEPLAQARSGAPLTAVAHAQR